MEPEIPELRQPWLVASFEGWNDAADAASGVVDHLIDEWDAQPLVEMDPEEFYDFQVSRPHMVRDDDGKRVLQWQTSAIYYASPPGSDRDVLLVRGLEPNYRWRQFASTLTGLASLAGATDVVLLGALLADSPHTRPVPVQGQSTDPLMSERLSLTESTYTGPVGINAVVADSAADQGMGVVSLWAAVPHYLAEPPCPKATLALLHRLEDVLQMPLPQGVLPEMAEAWQRGADELLERDEDVAEYVQALESERDESELPEASGDAIAREFERYLRRRGTGGAD